MLRLKREKPKKTSPTYTSEVDVGLFLMLVLCMGVIFMHTSFGQAAAPLNQHDWNFVNPGPAIQFGSWADYSVKDNGVVTGSDVHLESVNYVVTQRSDDGLTDTCLATGCSTGDGFNRGNFTNTVVSGRGPAARVHLSRTPVFTDWSKRLTGSLDTIGTAQGVAVVGTAAYVADGMGGLRVINIIDPMNPTLAMTMTSSAPDTRGVTIVGTTAYVADGVNGLKIFNLATPLSPTLTGTFDPDGAATGGIAYGVAVAGNFAYVAQGASGLQIFNTTLAGSPTLQAPSADARNVDISGSRVYVADGSAGLKIFDVTNASSPNFPSPAGQGSVPLGGIAYDVAVSGNYAYVAAGTSGLLAVNVSTPGLPGPTTTYNIPGDARGVTIDGTALYVADNASGLHIFRMTSPATATLKRIGAYETTVGAAAVAVVNGTTAYLADGADGLRIITISAPSAPVLKKIVSTPGKANDIVIEGRYAYAVDANNSLTIFDLSTPSDPMLTGMLSSLGEAWDIDVEGNYAYVAGGFGGLKIIDISTPATPTLAAIAAAAVAKGVRVAGNYAYVTGDSGLQVFNIKDPPNPTLQTTFTTGGIAYNSDVAANLAYIADDTAGLVVLDVTNPASPTLKGTVSTAGNARDVDVAGRYAYIAEKAPASKGYLQIIDVFDPANPTLVSTYNSNGEVWDVTVAGNYAYITDVNSGLKVINISDPLKPVLAAVYDTQGVAKGVKVEGNYAYVVDAAAGLSALKMTDFVDSGAFESAVMDLGGLQDFKFIRWSPPFVSPLFTMQARAGTTAAPPTGWTAWTAITNGTDLGTTFDSNRYLQYKVTLNNALDPSFSPNLDVFKLDFSNYPVGAGLESSVFDTGDQDNFLKNIFWSETGVTTLFDVRLQVATSGDKINWNYCGTNACQTSGWLDWNASANNYYTIAGDLIHLQSSDAVNDQFFKYKVWLSGDGTGTPAIDDISITFDSARLDLTSTTSTPTAGTSFPITVTVKDSSNVVMTGHDSSITLKLTASVPQPDLGSCLSSFSSNSNKDFITSGTYGAGADPSGVMTITNVKLCKATSTGFTISAQETIGGALNSTTNLTISAVNLDTASLQLAFDQLSTQYVATENFSPPLKVNIQDQYGNIDTLNTTPISLSAFSDVQCSSTPAPGTFNGGSGLAAVAGVAAFAGVNHDKAGTIYIKASDSGNVFSFICSPAITIVGERFVVQIDALYDAAKDAIQVTSSLLKNGSLVSDVSGITITALTKMDITDSNAVSLSGGINGADVSTAFDSNNAVFHTVWDPALGLDVSVKYTVQSDIKYQGTTYSGISTFHISELGRVSSDLKGLGTKLDAVQTTVSGIDTKAGKVIINVSSLDTKITAYQASQAAYRAQTKTKLASLVAKMGSILEDTSTALPKALKDTISAELAKGSQTEIVTTQSLVRTGATIPFRFRTITGLKPTITVFNPSDVEKISSAPMSEVGGTGIYTYNLTFNTDWGLGDFMIRVDESTQPSVDHVILNVVEATAGSSGSTGSSFGSSAITLDTLFSRITNVDSNMETLLSDVDTVKGNTENVSTDIAEVIKEMDKFTSTQPARKGDVSKLGGYLNSVSSIIGSSGNTRDYKTILGKLNNIEGILNGIGTDANAAKDFNISAREKAQKIRGFVTMVMTELKEKGSVEDPQVKVEILEDYLTELKETVEEIPGSVTTGSITESVESTLNELNQATMDNEGLKDIVPLVEQDMDITEVKSAEDLSASDLLDMRNDVSGLKSLMVEIRGLLDEEVNAPVVHGWLEGN